MTAPLFYLTVRSVRNGLRARVRRLRQARYLVGLIVGGLYFYWFIFGQRSRSGRQAGSLFELAGRYRETIVLAGAIALLVGMTLAWLWPGHRRLRLGFSRADVQFLFTAPISRARLIRYRVLRSQIGVLFGAAVVTLFWRPGGATSGWMFLVGTALLLATVNVHLIAMSLVLQPAAALQSGWPSRRLVRLVLVGTCALVIAAGVRSMSADPSLEAWFGNLTIRLTEAPAVIALWPWKALVRLPLSTTAMDFGRQLPAALGILALNFAWVMRSTVPFEEAAAELAERRTSALAGPEPVARRSSAGGRVPFRLAPAGRPEVALLWKNLLMLGRYVSVRLVVRMGALLVIVGALASRTGRGAGPMAILAAFAFLAALFTVLLGPQIVRIDLRQDLAYLETLKVWPLRGAEIVRGEVLAPTLILTGVAWLALLLATALGRNWQTGGPAWLGGGPWIWAIAAMLVGAGLILAQVIAQNAVAVAFPAWVRIGGGRPQGIDVVGQRMLMLAGMFVVVALAAVPAVLVGAVAGGVAYALIGHVPVLLCAVPAAGTLLVEATVAIEALGALLDRTDVSAIEARE